MYLRIENNVVLEIIADIDPLFPGVPIEKRYHATFIEKLQPVSDDVEVEQNWVYDPETGTFSEPPTPEIVEPEEDPGLDDVDPETGATGWAEMAAAIREGVNDV